jgi:hypothetical protein
MQIFGNIISCKCRESVLIGYKAEVLSFDFSFKLDSVVLHE